MNSSNRVKITYNAYKAAAEEIARQIRESKCRYKKIYPIPRGGYIIAIQLSRLLCIPIECDKEEIKNNRRVQRL